MNLIGLIAGVGSLFLAVAMTVIARPRDGISLRFLRNENVVLFYAVVCLTVFVVGFVLIFSSVL